MSEPSPPESSGRERRLEEILAAFLTAEDGGHPPDLESLLTRYPDLADELRSFLGEYDHIKKLVAPLRAAGGGGEVLEVFGPDPGATLPPSPRLTRDPGATVSVTPNDSVERDLIETGARIRYFGDYELLDVLGKGGMGVVYKARQLSLNRPVAVKMLQASILANEDNLRRFQNEAEAVAMLDHPHIVPILEVGQYEDQRYFSMKLIDGPSLDRKLREYINNPKGAARLVCTVAEAVHHAHQRGILHRDLKPGNVLLDERGEPHVTDFGLAKRVQADGDLTQSGAILGTPAYMAPEQAAGQREAVTRATDVYGLGAILYALLTGRAPFTGDTPLEVLQEVRERVPEPASKHNSRVPRDLEVICMKCLEKDPSRRYGQPDALSEDLERWLAGEPIKARPVGPLERGWRWCRRNPSWAGLSGSLVVSLIAVAVAAAVLGGWIADRKPIGTGVPVRPSASGASIPADTSTPRGRLAIRLPDQETTVEIGGDGDLTTLVGLGTHEISRPKGRYPLKVMNGSSTRVEVAEVIPDRRVEVMIGSDPKPGPQWMTDETRWLDQPLLLTLRPGGHTGPVTGLCFLSEGSHLLSAGRDKVIQDWSLRDSTPTIDRTFRPPIWRGSAGIIDAMAVSPRPDAQGQSFLAVAGFGIESSRGDITVFRIPGLVRTPTGEVAARMLPPSGDQPQAMGHRNAVSCLAFDPTGRVLASGSADYTIILWEAPGFRPRAVLRGHTGGIRAIAFSPDGSRLASGGRDGTLRIWNVAQGTEAVPPRAATNPINALAYSPDGRSIVVGREAPGRLQLYRADDLAAVPAQLRTREGQGPVECVAFHPDVRVPRLAVSIKSDASQVPDAMRMSCDIEIRDMPAGNIVHQRRVPGLVRTLAFSPDGSRLAYAGGPAQAVYILDLAALDTPPLELKGEGSTPFDLGFSDDSQVIGFTRERFDPANPPRLYEGFDLGQRRPRTVRRDQLPRRAIPQFQGWTLQRGGKTTEIVAVHVNGQTRTFAIDERLERHAWSWTFVPGKPAHPADTVAIGTESGVAIFAFETGERTRVYAGHSSPVVSLAPSPDGRWLASSSLDQTVLLYPLEGCDTRPPLGADIRVRPNGALAASKVERGSVAAAMGMLPGDMLLNIGIAGGTEGLKYYRTAEDMDGFLSQVLPLRAPSIYKVGITVRRTILIPTIGFVTFETLLPTSRRNNPALTLFLSVDKEWIVWTPQGYYDTSPAADQKFLEWYRNRLSTSQPAEFFPAVTFETQFRRPDLIAELIGSDDPARYAASLRRPIPRLQPEPHRLKVLAFGLGGMTGKPVPPISFAERDARHIADRLVQTGAGFGFGQVTARAIFGADTTADKIKEALLDLEVESRARRPRAGDTVVIFLESRLHHGEQGLLLLGSNSVVEPSPTHALSATEVGDHWKRLVERGYQVLVFLDLRHSFDPESLEGPLTEWVRDLFRSGVLICLASRDGPGLRNDRSSRGAFAEGLLETLAEAADRGTLRTSRPVLTLESLTKSLQAKVRSLTDGAQQPSSYSIDPPARTPVLDPISVERRSENGSASPQ